MRHTRLVVAVGVSLCLAVAVASQVEVSAPLSGPLRDQVKGGRFDTVTSIRGLPLGVRGELQTLFGSSGLDIAEPGAAFEASRGTPTQPTRRLLVAGCTIDYCLIYYERGGGAHTWHVALFHWTPDGTRFEWGGTAPGGLATIDDVRNAVLSGVIKGPAKVW